MSEKYPGGLITKTPVTPAGPYQTGAASGVWTRDQQLQYQQQGIWPTAGLTPNYIEDVFSTYLYTGNGSTQTITNGINLSGKGGLVWIKTRNDATNHALFDTTRGVTKRLQSNTTNAETTTGGTLTSFNTTGFDVGYNYDVNGSPNSQASWTFRKQAKFFDVVTYTGTGAGYNIISHNLGSTPGCIIIKRTDDTSDWFVWHRKDGSANSVNGLSLNLTDAAVFPNFGMSTYVNSSTFAAGLIYSANTGLANVAGATYVAYLFAHDAGGFGAAGTDNVITCGSFTTNGSTDAFVSLGYEPQWLMIKNSAAAGGWIMVDNMRGLPVGSADPYLMAQSANAETTSNDWANITATGFYPSWFNLNTTSTYIYIAIRRGPMKTPTDATKVFAPVTVTGNDVDNRQVSSGFVTDFVVGNRRTGAVGANGAFVDRLRGPTPILYSYATDAEATGNVGVRSFAVQDGMTVGGNTAYSFNYSGQTYVNWMFQRAPGFFDEVCYTGTGVATTQTHNLGAVPELMIIKRRSALGSWCTFFGMDVSNYYRPLLNSSASAPLVTYSDGYGLSAKPTSTVINLDSGGAGNDAGTTYVAYLFATLAGVSKVGTYTGNGTTQTIDCGFTGGARFVLIKRTDAAGDWYTYDTARGMTTLTDPYLLMNSSATEVATLGSVTTVSTGFALNSTILAAINVSGGTYIFLAIA